MSSRNRRKHVRVPAKGIATHYRSGELTALAMPVENVSVGGAFVRTDDPLPVGTPLALELLDGTPAKPMKLTARVAGVVSPAQGREHGRVAGMGLRFDPLDDETRKRVERLVLALRDRSSSLASVVNEEMQDARKQTFDFGFASLEGFSLVEEEDAPAHRARAYEASRVPAPPARIPTPPPPPRPPAPEPSRVEVRVPAPDAQVPVPPEAKLMVQVRGLLLELSETREELRKKEQEVERLQAEVAQLKARLNDRR